MTKKDFIEKTGTVIEALPNGRFLVEIGREEDVVTGYLSGKMRRFKIWILPGDKVKLEFSKYDDKMGRITHRFK